MKYSSSVRVTPSGIVLNEKRLAFASSGEDLLVEAYRKQIGDWPKFFKMDPLSKAGFVSSELLLSSEEPRKHDCEDRAVILYNRSGSLADDRIYEGTIRSKEEFYPSPAVFVYTLPNILTGEIAIRNKYYGETSFSVLEEFDPTTMIHGLESAFLDPMTASAIFGWVECGSEDDFDVCLFLVHKEGEGLKDFDEKEFLRIWKI